MRQNTKCGKTQKCKKKWYGKKTQLWQISKTQNKPLQKIARWEHKNMKLW